MTSVNGNGKDNVLVGTDRADLIVGAGGNDTITGNGEGDVIRGGGLALNPVPNAIVISENKTARVAFAGEDAGYKNTIGMYKIAADGTITDVRIVFANASAKGSGGDLVSGVSSVDVEVERGDQIGFFILSDGAGSSANRARLSDKTSTYVLRNSAGGPANAGDKGPLTLVQIDTETGKETVLSGAYGTKTFHSLGDDGSGYNLNGDRVKHVLMTADPSGGSYAIGFEDLDNGGDKDFNDVKLRMTFTDPTGAGGPGSGSGSARQDDLLDGGKGHDTIYGGSGHDTLYGDADNDDLNGDSGADLLYGDEGDDRLNGGGGADRLEGGAGNDSLAGGKDGDTLSGGDGKDVLSGASGNDSLAGGLDDDTLNGASGDDELAGGEGGDRLDGGSGRDTLAGGIGNDTVNGGGSDDGMTADAGDDSYKGGSGFDTLDFSAAGQGVTVSLDKHTASGFGNDAVWSVEAVAGSSHADSLNGDKRDNRLAGGEGDDSLRGAMGNDTLAGGEGDDTFVWKLKDVVGAGKESFLDHVEDFGRGDVLDFTALADLGKGQSVEDVVQVVKMSGGLALSVFFAGDGQWHNVAVLDGTSDVDIAALHAGGQLLV